MKDEAKRLAEISLGYSSVTVSMSTELYNEIMDLAHKHKCTFQTVARLALAEHVVAQRAEDAAKVQARAQE